MRIDGRLLKNSSFRTAFICCSLFIVHCSLFTVRSFAADANPAKKPAGPKTTKVDNMQWGPFISYSLGKVQASDGVVTGKEYGNKEALLLKGIIVPLNPARDINVAFDTDLLRYAVGWSGGFLDFSKSNGGQYKGDEPPHAVGTRRASERSWRRAWELEISKTTAARRQGRCLRQWGTIKGCIQTPAR